MSTSEDGGDTHVRSFEVIVDSLENNPHCLHGPTLIFRKNSGKTRDYYACSACRDQKSCNFHFPVNEKKEVLLKSSNFWKKQQKQILSSIKKNKPYEKFSKILKAFKNMKAREKCSEKLQAGYCYICNCLFEKVDHKMHEKCKTMSNLTYTQLTNPTSIIIPKVNTKTHAQYFFSKSAVEEILLLLIRLKASKVLCIGVPRIHEHIVNNHKNKIKSLLLDFDKNYFNFYDRSEFIWYNMFNNYIFDSEQKAVLSQFLNSSKIVVLMDPPFGGRVEPLANTLNELNKTFAEVNKTTYEIGKLMLETFWFFPYFMESHIRDSLPDFKMFDYKVNYDNHTSFTDEGKRKRKFGSPVRIFTNVPLHLLDLSGVSGYKFCGSCGYWVSKENKHCEECNACASKNGRTYIHCTKCSKCVKPSYKHCSTCSRCCLPDHVCGEFRPNTNCYHCHQPGHKKKDCLLLNENGKRTKAVSAKPRKKKRIS